MVDLIKSKNGKVLLKASVTDDNEVIDDDFDCVSSYSFAGLANLKEITFNGIIKKVEPKAFIDCPKLRLVRFPNSDKVELSRNFSVNCSDDFECSKAGQPVFKPVSVSYLLGKSFFINDYQRGYRWGKDEVSALLVDIFESFQKSNGKDDYYLQPLVLCSEMQCDNTITVDEVLRNGSAGPRKGNAYEVIDGQQRLTTMYILLTALGISSAFNIYYKYVRQVDSDFIKQAEEEIDNGIKHLKINKTTFVEYIKNQVKYIWYEITDSKVNTKKLFREFNSGKTPLTNSELFRAFLFNRSNFLSGVTPAEYDDRNKELNIISMEWDHVEQSLKEDDFWFFLSNSAYEDKNRMDYVLDLYASQQIDKYKKGLNDKKERYSFIVFVKHFEDLQKTKGPFGAMKAIWSEIKDTYDRLYSWYMDTELFNYIGYLIAIEASGDKFEDSLVPAVTMEILKSSKKYHKPDFKEDIRKKIKKIFDGVAFAELKWKSKKTREALLLLNIWQTTQNDNAIQRFPFNLYKNSFMDKDKEQRIVWNIEHVNAHQLSTDLIGNCENAVKEKCKAEGKTFIKNDPAVQEDIKKRLVEQVGYLCEELDDPKSIYYDSRSTLDQSDIDILKGFKCKKVYSSTDITDLEGSWKNICNLLNEAMQDEDARINQISNLALLDEKTNKGYGNSFFQEKRASIVERDKTSAYIPVCTRNIFLKYYGTSKLFWGTDDMDEIMKELIEPCKKCFGIK